MYTVSYHLPNATPARLISPIMRAKLRWQAETKAAAPGSRRGHWRAGGADACGAGRASHCSVPKRSSSRAAGMGRRAALAWETIAALRGGEGMSDTCVAISPIASTFRRFRQPWRGSAVGKAIRIIVLARRLCKTNPSDCPAQLSNIGRFLVMVTCLLLFVIGYK